jgi:dihydroorotase
MIDRNHMLVGGIRPHYYCLPIVKRGAHREALARAVTTGEPRLFLGTDSAPHLDGAKLATCGCAGVFSASNTMGCLAQLFEEAGALDRLEAFTSERGADFYRLARNEETITLERTDAPLPVPTPLEVAGEGTLTTFDPARPIHWRVV